MDSELYSRLGSPLWDQDSGNIPRKTLALYSGIDIVQMYNYLQEI